MSDWNTDCSDCSDCSQGSCWNVERMKGISQGRDFLSQRVSLLSKARGLTTDGLRAGLMPEKGWARRNLRFMSRSLIPTMLQRRGASTSGERPGYGGLQQNEIEVMWIGHASFLVRTPWMNILIDPNWAMWHGPVKRARRPGLRLDHLPPIDLILITHAHFDHLHRPSLKRIANGHQTVLVPQGVGKLLRRIPVRQVKEMENWQCHLHGEVEVIFTPSYHWGARYIHDTHRGFGGFLIRTPHSSLYHCGDSAYFDGFAELGRQFDVDTALLPIGAYDSPSGRDVHMNPEEALQAFEDMGARSMVPMHYATFPLGNEHLDEPLRRLEASARERGIADRVIAPREGEALVFGARG